MFLRDGVQVPVMLGLVEVWIASWETSEELFHAAQASLKQQNIEVRAL